MFLIEIICSHGFNYSYPILINYTQIQGLITHLNPLFSVTWFWFGGISTIVGYLMPNPVFT